ncbi:hypothetical protein BGZ63DRAFT_481573 [Mariannaea sp. PMI_226]|nr:hypothetical protein BGZ63DRAFT_481573 [Mariannaea sp. PMI_226]
MDTAESSSVGAGPKPAGRKRISTACEACRATKIKCQPSEQPGVCRKCLESKRECISRTGPRTRRRRTKLAGDDSLPQLPPATGPSKTFTIDFDIPSQPEPDENFDALRDAHEQVMDNIFLSEPDPDVFDSTSPSMMGFPTPPSSHSHSIASLHAKPQFNLNSAESLLTSFRGMLSHFPCIVLSPEDTVSSLAATRPFVLLSILAAASGSRTLQGHTLYDEEFRKVLGLKFVAGGERSLELLQGMLIYCAWYPFHLRPKNKQAIQYVRMAGDLARDMELDQELPELSSGVATEVTSEQLEKIRTYLSWFYIVSNFMTAWKQLSIMEPFTAWTAICCDIMERFAEVDGDLSLSYLVRLASYTIAAKVAMHESMAPSEQQSQLVLFGLEAQSRELRQVMLPHIAISAPVRFSELFFSVYLNGGPILHLGRPKTKPTGFIPPSIDKLRICLDELKSLFHFLTNLDASAYAAFCCNDWTKFILITILGVRLSFPIPDLPSWDDAWARSELRLDDFLAHMCEGAELTSVDTRVDAFSASRVVMRVVKTKYDRRISSHRKVEEAAAAAAAAAMVTATATAATTPSRSTQGCPMFDNNMEPYIAAWDNAGLNGADALQSIMPTATRDQQDSQQPVFHDLWATMTQGWANTEFEEEPPMDMLGLPP